jgi:hypothetical protein
VQGVAHVGAAAIATVLLGVAAAYAYFTAAGSLSGPGSVGSATAWSVTGAAGSGAPSSAVKMYPGGAPAAFTFRITDAGDGHQALQQASVVFVTTTDGAGNTVLVDDATGDPVEGCLSSWFTVGSSSFVDGSGRATTLPIDLTGGGYVTGTTAVAMANAGVAQSACEGANPRLTVTAG